MRTERRCVQRKRPGGISYFEFEGGRGGIVLDASEKGLGFQAADAVYQLGPSRIWISPHPEERIELTCDVVWIDASRKTGGLRFIENGGDSSRKIRSWLGQGREPEAGLGSQHFPLPAWAKQESGDLEHAVRPAASFRAPAATRVAKTEGDAQRPIGLHPIPGLPSLFTSTLPWQSQDTPTSNGRVAFRVATGFLIVALAVASVVLFDMFRPEVGDALIHLGEKINGSTKLQPQSSSALPNAAQVPAAASPRNEAKPDAAETEEKLDVVQKEAPEDSGKPLDSPRKTNTHTADAMIPSATPITKATPDRLPHPLLPNSTKDRSAEATRLWSAVASGDSVAEVDLARLYLKGEGVSRNCEQAKVLLRAAAKGGSVEARQLLKKLRIRSCR